MGDRTGRLSALAVTTVALAAVVAVETAPGRTPPAPDFGPALPAPAAPAPPAAAAGPGRAHAADTPDAADTPEQAPAEQAAPRRVLVRAIGLDAPVRPVGVTPRGDMDVPSDPAEAGWYRFGPEPGSGQGSAVLVGHVDGDTGALGTFALLREVEPGDRVEVRRAGAEPVGYRVTARTTVAKEALPPDVFRRDGPPVLTLVTCAPPFVPDEGGYRSNMIVVAEPLGE
ncbi:class F sortase [Streptomyces chilikensis]|uniref:class F sortase n=1 Tax=Streptomyces chilikensis TaxID=1194079 RepID=UPI001F10F19F|nr:class F sortase [Streptomyces chilikensis]